MNAVSAGLSDLLCQRWRARFPDMGGMGADLVARYADPGRVYHDAGHLFDVLAGVDLLRDGCPDASAVELAAWFHDAVYDVRAADNEAASAELAGDLLTPYLTAETVDEVTRLVLLTRDHRVEADDANGAVLSDADLAILASARERYDDYVARIRLEYAHVPPDIFRERRGEVLRALLALPHLFHTPYGAREWEAPSRANLRRELHSLG